VSRSDNSRQGSRPHWWYRGLRPFMRAEHAQHEKRIRRATDSSALGELVHAGDCPACGWITGRDRCPMCGAEIDRRDT
jgi:rubrerythrin